MLSRWYTRWVERLRTQPPAVKSQVALLGAAAITAIIAIVWVTTLPARFSTLSGASSAVRESVSESLETAPNQDALMQDAFTPEPEAVSEPAAQTEAELLRARIDALRDGTKQEDSAATSSVGRPVLIETR